MNQSNASRFPTPGLTGSGSKGLIRWNHLSSVELPQGLEANEGYWKMIDLSMSMTSFSLPDVCCFPLQGGVDVIITDFG